MPLRRFLPRRDLVMGFATGYRVETIAPFVESLISDGQFVGEAVLFIRPDDPELRTYLRARGIRTAAFDAKLAPHPDVMLARWFAYRDYLQRRIAKGKRYRNILITDVRDVIFQKPLFSLPCAALEYHFEAPEPRIGACPINSGWIRQWFGEEELARLAGERITCAGTLTGRQDGVAAYLDAMTRLIAAHAAESRINPGGDQGLHNYIAHHGLIEAASFLDNYRRVATLHYVDGADLRPDEAGRVVNPDGSVSEIAHQWDRHPHLATAIAASGAERRRATDDPLRRNGQVLGNWIRRLTHPDPWRRRLRRILPPGRNELDAVAASSRIALERANAEIAALQSGLAEHSASHQERIRQLEHRLGELSERNLVLETLVTHSAAARPPGASEAVARIAAPAVSIILPTYNRARFVGDAIESIRAQSFVKWELIVVDDGSKDDTQEAVARFLFDERIRYVRQAQSGSSVARNRGLDETSAPLVAYLDSDNLWYPDFLACAVDYLATHPDVNMLYGALVTDLHSLDVTNVLWRSFDRAALASGNFIDTNVMVHRRALLTKYGNWDPRLSRVNDWDLALRFTAEEPAHPLPVIAAYYRSCDGIRVTDVDPVDHEIAIVREKLKTGDPAPD